MKQSKLVKVKLKYSAGAIREFRGILQDLNKETYLTLKEPVDGEVEEYAVTKDGAKSIILSEYIIVVEINSKEYIPTIFKTLDDLGDITECYLKLEAING